MPHMAEADSLIALVRLITERSQRFIQSLCREVWEGLT